MKFFLSSLGLCLVALTLSSCGSKGTAGNSSIPQGATGPFDRNGNYVEAWADTPSKWKKGRTTVPTPEETPDIPQVASNEQPPSNSIPISTQTRPTTQKTQPVEVASLKKPATSGSSIKPKPKTTEVTKRVVRDEDEDRPKVASKATTTKPKPKTEVASKAKPKPKAKTTRVVVKKGDSLSAIASRNGTSVGAIQRANGISGALIRPGQSLVIPK